jgi:hypothetical protein
MHQIILQDRYSWPYTVVLKSLNIGTKCFILCCSNVSISQPLMKCKRVFQALINIAIEELCETADALIAPVRLGVARPTAPFSLVPSNIDAIQVFSFFIHCIFVIINFVVHSWQISLASSMPKAVRPVFNDRSLCLSVSRAVNKG